MDYKEIFKRQRDAEDRIINCFGDPTDASGVYRFLRYSPEKEKLCVYVGQAKHLRQRIAQHLLEHDDHLAKSLKAHGLCNITSPDGWRVEWEFWELDELDKRESEQIAFFVTSQTRKFTISQAAGKARARLISTSELSVEVFIQARMMVIVEPMPR